MKKIINTQHRLEEIKREGYRLDIGEVFTKTFENYSKIVWVSGAGILLMSFVFLVLAFGVSIIFLGLDAAGETFTDFQFQQFSTFGIIIALLAGIIATAAIKPFYAGILRVAYLADIKKEFDFSSLFYYYKSEKLKDLILAGIIIAALSSTISTLLQFSGIIFLGNLMTYLLLMLTLFTTPLIIFGNLKAIPAIEASLLLVIRNFFIILILLIAGGILSMLGVIALCVGVFFSLPILFSMQYSIYASTFEVDERSEIDDIGIPIE